MKGYYIIPTNGEPIEVTGRGAKAKALKMAKELYLNGDIEVFIKRFDDDYAEGYFADQETIYVSDLR